MRSSSCRAAYRRTYDDMDNTRRDDEYDRRQADVHRSAEEQHSSEWADSEPLYYNSRPAHDR